MELDKYFEKNELEVCLCFAECICETFFYYMISPKNKQWLPSTQLIQGIRDRYPLRRASLPEWSSFEGLGKLKKIHKTLDALEKEGILTKIEFEGISYKLNLS